MSGMPGAFEPIEAIEEPSTSAAGALDPALSSPEWQGIVDDSEMDETTDDGEFGLEALEDDGGEAIDLDEDEEDQEEAGQDEDEMPGGQLQIAYDASSGQILLIDSSGNASRLTERHLRGSTLSLASIRAMLVARLRSGGGMLGGDEDDDEDFEDVDDDDDDDEDMRGYGTSRRRRPRNFYDPVIEPLEAGICLERSGQFGIPPKKYGSASRKFIDYSPNLATVFRAREYDHRRTPKSSIGDFTVPNSSGCEVSQFQSKVYSGQYSNDGSFFYTASQDFSVYIYDTRTPPQTGSKSVTDTALPSRRRASGNYWQHRSSLKTLKVIKANERNCRWTITDASVSADDKWMVYSSITPRVHLVRTGEGADWEADDSEQSTLDFAAGMRGSPSFGIWSVRFSNDSKEVVAGANDGQIFVYDIETRRTILRVNAHKDDVNAVAFADIASSNLLLSGSDDKFVKVWDRRSLSGERASGTLVGHTEGITFVAPKGDGRYCLSNGKDQAMKLWDLRSMVSDETFDQLKLDRVEYGIPGWDYRQSYYSKPKYLEHPNDVSVMTFRGHAVLRTLIRCHFSPVATTSQRYVYSGSSDGKIHIWSLDGRIVQTLDRRNTHPLINSVTGEYNDPSALDLRSTTASVRGTAGSTVRDVSWHPYESSIMSTAWENRGGIEGSIAKHEWKGAVGETLEDQIERSGLEASG